MERERERERDFLQNSDIYSPNYSFDGSNSKMHPQKER
jgi:hypothetical protein